jgi:hypothetical protein
VRQIGLCVIDRHRGITTAAKKIQRKGAKAKSFS